jgi:hypothetical protein
MDMQSKGWSSILPSGQEGLLVFWICILSRCSMLGDPLLRVASLDRGSVDAASLFSPGTDAGVADPEWQIQSSPFRDCYKYVLNLLF